MIDIADSFNLNEYLGRINLEGFSPSVSLECLVQICKAQVRSIPFENTQVQAKKIPSLDANAIYQRVVKEAKGGYCYELNGLLAMALQTIGFRLYLAAARPLFYPNKRPRTHMVVIVSLADEVYLCDVAYGGYGLREPLLVRTGKTTQDYDQFLLEQSGDEYELLTLVDGAFVRQYGFKLVPQEFIEFSLANYFNATHPDTIFTQRKIAIIHTPTGKKIQMDNELKIFDKGVLHTQSIDYESALKNHFYSY